MNYIYQVDNEKDPLTRTGALLNNCIAYVRKKNRKRMYVQPCITSDRVHVHLKMA